MDIVQILIVTPKTLAPEIEQFAADHPAEVSFERAAEDKQGIHALGFEPITTIAAIAWLAKFGAGVASGLITKLLADRLFKTPAPAAASSVEIQIAFPNGNVVTIRGAEKLTHQQLETLVSDNLES